MAYEAKRVVQVKVVAPDAPGLLARVLRELRDNGLGLLSLAAWAEGGQAVFLSVPEELNKARELAMREGISMEETPAIYIVGDNEVGALVPATEALSSAGVNLVAAMAVAAGDKYGAVLVPQPDQYEQACKALDI